MFNDKDEAWESFREKCPWKNSDDKCKAQVEGCMGLTWQRHCEDKRSCALWYMFAVFPFGDYE